MNSNPKSKIEDPRSHWLRERARLAPGLLTRAPAWVQEVFEHPWAPMQALAHEVAGLPGQLWSFLLDHDGGWIVVHPGDSRYVVGPSRVAAAERRNVAFISVQDLARGDELPLQVIGHLIDHYLGCAGDPDGLWLSGGGGLRPAWREAGERLGRLFALGHAVDAVAAAGVQDYLARSLVWYCRRPGELNVADPNMWKWFRATLWDEGWWRPPVSQGRL